ncbi:MAG: hypothetical protein ACXVX5_14885 [Mycobacterium sp.]
MIHEVSGLGVAFAYEAVTTATTDSDTTVEITIDRGQLRRTGV